MKSIILIGPMRAGKTTIARLLAETLSIPNISFDQIRKEFYPEHGYEAEKASQAYKDGGFEAWLAYQRPFEVLLVEHVLKHYPENHVIDFGAGHSVQEDDQRFERVKQALMGFPHVILLRPCEDDGEALRILHQRDIDDAESGLPEINRLFVKHPSNKQLATHTIYNQDQSPQQTCTAILELLKTR
jgi:shikimate kinase